MTRKTLLSASLLLGLAILIPALRAAPAAPVTPPTAPVAEDDEDTGEGDEHGETKEMELPIHVRAPGQIDVTVAEDDLVRAPGEEWFEAMAEEHPERFTYSDEAAEYTDEDGNPDGEFEGGWIDAKGEYVFLYDYEEDEFAYWQKLKASQLTRGRALFIQYCASCHGFDGAGYGRSAQHLRPPPRSFHQSNFKFTQTPSSTLPSDDALTELILAGLDGTPMYPWALQESQVRDIVQYIKTLSPPESGWRDIYAVISDVIDIGEDPWAGKEADGVARGEVVYHLNQCWSCHPSYLSDADISELYVADDKPAQDSYRTDIGIPQPTQSTYEVQGYAVKILPPDFTWHTIRRGRTASDIAHTVAAGIAGAGMPQWKGPMSDEDLWALGHYVRKLIDDYHGQPAKRAAFMATVRN